MINKSSDVLITRFNRIRDEIKKESKAARRRYLAYVENQIINDPTIFRKHVNNIQWVSKNSIVLNVDDRRISHPVDVANEFERFFASVYEPMLPYYDKYMDEGTYTINDELIHGMSDGMIKALKQLTNKNSMGPDGIPCRLIN